MLGWWHRKVWRELNTLHIKSDGLRALITDQGRTLKRVEKLIMAMREEFNQGLSELGSAITELSARIGQLPESVDDLTQDDLDTLRSLTGRVNQLAVAAPEVPTEEDSGTDVPA